MVKKILKKIFGKFYYELRLKKIIKYIFKKNLSFKNIKFFQFNFNKKNFNQKIVAKETGAILNFTKDNYLTYHLRPKNSKNFLLKSTSNVKENFAIVIQGPIGDLYKFLTETLNIYYNIFPNSIFIISTWETENFNKIKELENDKTFILFNKEPNPSPHNIDHQTHSTSEALKLAKSKGFNYSIKTRTDTRILKNNLEAFFFSLINLFPLNKKNLYIKQRIFLPSLGTFKFRLYGLSDLIMFGHTEDLLLYFDNDPYLTSIEKYFNSNEIIFHNKIPFINQTPVVAEIFLCSRFISRFVSKVEWSLDEWWNVLKEYFCVIDDSSIDTFWYKYEWQFEYRFTKTYAHQFSRGLDFSEWISLYNNQKLKWKDISSEHEKYDERRSLINFK